MTILIVGAAIGFLSAFLLRSWQYRRDLWLKRIEVLCAVLDLAAEASTKYWVGDATTIPSVAAASRILGLQVRVDGMFASLDLASHPKLTLLLGDFRDSLTGGDFESAVFSADPDRARLAQMYASDLITEIWAAAYSQLSFAYWRGRRLREMKACWRWSTDRLIKANSLLLRKRTWSRRQE